MKLEPWHSGEFEPRQARALQEKLAQQVATTGALLSPRLIAGVDIHAPLVRGIATAAVVVLNYPELKVVEVKVATAKLDVPYIPGLLAFREAPLILEACEQLGVTPDLFLVDGQGIAHPRRLGLASHLGLFWSKPTIGCAKSRLCGECAEPGNHPGDYAEISDNGEIIGAALRTKEEMKPLYVSIGHQVDLPTAMQWVLHCCRGYRLPEPTRLAHLAAGGNLKVEESITGTEPLKLF